MSYFNMVCDSCGREVHGCNIVNGMKFCAKCYQKTFGETDKDRKITDLEAKLAEKERQYETLYKLFSEQHEIIDQNELECFEEVNRLLKEQKDFYVVEKTEYDKMKQGAKDIVMQLKQQLAEKDKELSEYVKIVDDLHKQLSDKCDFCDKTKDQYKILFAIEQLEKVKGLIANHTQELWTCENDDIDLVLYEEIDNQIKELKGEE